MLMHGGVLPKYGVLEELVFIGENYGDMGEMVGNLKKRDMLRQVIDQGLSLKNNERSARSTYGVSGDLDVSLFEENVYRLLERNVNLGILGSILHNPLANEIIIRSNAKFEVELAPLTKLNGWKKIEPIQGLGQEAIEKKLEENG